MKHSLENFPPKKNIYFPMVELNFLHTYIHIIIQLIYLFFSATILWHKKTFWTDVKAQITYDANCAGETPTTAIPEESAICGANIHTAGVLLLTLQLVAFYVFALA